MGKGREWRSGDGGKSSASGIDGVNRNAAGKLIERIKKIAALVHDEGNGRESGSGSGQHFVQRAYGAIDGEERNIVVALIRGVDKFIGGMHENRRWRVARGIGRSQDGSKARSVVVNAKRGH